MFKTAYCVLLTANWYYMGLQYSTLATIIFGNSFSWADILAYTLGILIVFAVEKWKSVSKMVKSKKPIG